MTKLTDAWISIQGQQHTEQQLHWSWITTSPLIPTLNHTWGLLWITDISLYCALKTQFLPIPNMYSADTFTTDYLLNHCVEHLSSSCHYAAELKHASLRGWFTLVYSHLLSLQPQRTKRHSVKWVHNVPWHSVQITAKITQLRKRLRK